jgi:hypothetical protein
LRRQQVRRPESAVADYLKQAGKKAKKDKKMKVRHYITQPLV